MNSLTMNVPSPTKQEPSTGSKRKRDDDEVCATYRPVANYMLMCFRL